MWQSRDGGGGFLLLFLYETVETGILLRACELELGLSVDSYGEKRSFKYEFLS